MICQKWVYGHNALFPVPDIDRTQYMLCVGGNPLASNGSLWTVPNVKKRIQRLQKRGGQFVVIDPRCTETAKIANAHHFVRPGTDTAFFLALLLALDAAGLVNPRHLTPMLSGWEAAWSSIKAFDFEALCEYCGISKDVIRGGVMFPDSIIDPVERSGTGSYGRYKTRLSGRPEVLGELPSVELTAEITTQGEGQIGALLVIAGNPVISAPGGQHLDAALDTLDLMVSIDMYVTETSRHADYILPPCGPLERDHYPMFFTPLAIRNYAAYSKWR